MIKNSESFLGLRTLCKNRSKHVRSPYRGSKGGTPKMYASSMNTLSHNLSNPHKTPQQPYPPSTVPTPSFPLQSLQEPHPKPLPTHLLTYLPNFIRRKMKRHGSRSQVIIIIIGFKTLSFHFIEFDFIYPTRPNKQIKFTERWTMHALPFPPGPIPAVCNRPLPPSCRFHRLLAIRLCHPPRKEKKEKKGA